MQENREEFVPRGEVEEGKISISKEVITSIAGLAAAEVEGLAPPKGGEFPKGENVKRFVETEVGEGEVRVSIKVAVIYGYPVKDVAQRLQEKVKNEVERMTGLRVSAVNVEVTHLPRGRGEARRGGLRWPIWRSPSPCSFASGASSCCGSGSRGSPLKTSMWRASGGSCSGRSVLSCWPSGGGSGGKWHGPSRGSAPSAGARSGGNSSSPPGRSGS
ncbi:MAG: Asp23/Gls24 family envelope stress response protein [Caldiserica bacterium]|nr:Asp23/Gls24 family envelope stress response protein [Caldisericota bacterium]